MCVSCDAEHAAHIYDRDTVLAASTLFLRIVAIVERAVLSLMNSEYDGINGNHETRATNVRLLLSFASASRRNSESCTSNIVL